MGIIALKFEMATHRQIYVHKYRLYNTTNILPVFEKVNKAKEKIISNK
jgi:hypothetical protein